MAKKKTPRTVAKPTFEVRFIGPEIAPEKIPIRAVSDALSAIQDIASGRDPYEEQQVSPEKAIGLVDVERGSAVYSCVARAPKEALENIERVGLLISAPDRDRVDADSIVPALRPIKLLSDISRLIGCTVEVTATGRRRTPLCVVTRDDYRRISQKLFITGETTVVGEVKRAGGATGMRCLLRVPDRRRILYCNVQTKEVVRRLGQCLYQTIAATGTAVWLHNTWRVVEFTINDFTQPRMGNALETIEELRRAGLSAWDEIDNPEKFVREMR